MIQIKRARAGLGDCGSADESAVTDAQIAQILNEVRRPNVISAICSNYTGPAKPSILICAFALQKFLLGRVRYAMVFGSCAYGIDRDNSDLDILLVGDDLTGRTKAIVRLIAMETSGKEEVDIQEIASSGFHELASDPTSYLVGLAAGSLVMIVGDAQEFRDAVQLNRSLP